jgi:tetratricopeptide (TPR) repeat protein/predicted Ser/Thr protein kinase
MIAPAGRKLGKYEIQQKLGRGGMADVYLARDTELDSLVALKLIEHSSDADTRDSIEAERRGVQLQAHLAAVDPRVARVYDSGDLDGYFFVAMEYIDGQDLNELMRRGPLAVEFACDVALAVAHTLDNAHNLEVTLDGKDFHGIVHGDIKPRNIRIDARGEVRVLDFGIAKALSLSRKLTRNEFGSVPYASPERLDSGEVNADSDLWSLAVTLYEMVTGLQPYQSSTTAQLERMIRSRIAPPPAPDPCPEPLRRILMKAVAPHPELRYRSAREFAEDLRAFRAGEPVRAVSEDLDATRRTSRGGGAGLQAGQEARPTDDATRQTARGVPAASAAVEWPRVSRPKPAKPWPVGVMRAIWALGLAVVLFIAWSLFSSYRLYARGAEFARQVETEQITDPNDIWTQWKELSGDRSSSWLLRAPRALVKQKLVQSADRVIATYRNDAQQLFEGDWKRARTELAHALEADPDGEVRGRLRLCDGHLARINGVAHRNPSALNEAVQDFDEAQALLPKSPDPELGLARLYVYGLKDIDKARDALNQAESHGYKAGARDLAQLADGYRDRADRVWWDSRNVRGLPQEKEQIERALADYQTALGLYQGIVPYGNSSVQIVRVQTDMESVQTRLRELEAPVPAAQPEKTAGVLGRLLKALVGGSKAPPPASPGETSH